MTLNMFLEHMMPGMLLQYHPMLLITLGFAVVAFNWVMSVVWWEGLIRMPNFLRKRSFNTYE